MSVTSENSRRIAKNPLLLDKTHIHHKFLAMGITPRRSLVLTFLMPVLLCGGNILLAGLVDTPLLMFADIALWTGMDLYIDRVISRHGNL